MTGHALTITRTFRNVAPERVYVAWTDPHIVAEWYGPEGFVNVIHEMDVRVGGSYRLTMMAPDGGKHPLRGKFLELDPPRRLVFSWQWQDEETPDAVGNEETRVTVTLKPDGAHTVMTMVHDRFANAEQVENHNMGWTGAFGKLEKSLSNSK